MRYGERTRSGIRVNTWTRRQIANAYGVATGGSSSTITDGGFSWTLLSFTVDGTLTVSTAGRFECLLIGGGGGSGGTVTNTESTGGGAGASVLITTLFLPVGTYTVDVGAGGPGGNHDGSAVAITRENGLPSSIYDATGATTSYFVQAQGGGGGAGSWEQGLTNGQPMNMGGAGWRSGNFFGGVYASQNPLCFSGGGAFGVSGMAGGGAGAGGNGGSSTSTTTGGAGGAGRTTTFTGASVTYGSGGAGGNSASAGATGSAIGGGGGGKQNGVAVGNGTAGNAGAVYVRFRAN